MTTPLGKLVDQLRATRSANDQDGFEAALLELQQREQARSLPARAAAIDKASGDLLVLLERLDERIETEDLTLALGHARAIREALA